MPVIVKASGLFFSTMQVSLLKTNHSLLISIFECLWPIAICIDELERSNTLGLSLLLANAFLAMFLKGAYRSETQGPPMIAVLLFA